MDYFEDIYLKRLNRFGHRQQSRVQGEREHEFEMLLKKSAYRVDFFYDGIEQPGTLERYKQDETQTLQYLLTRRCLVMPHGTIIKTRNLKGKKKVWLILYLEEIKASGYNRYLVLELASLITIDGEEFYGRLIGPGRGFMRDTIESNARQSIYLEDFNSFLLITAKTPLIKKDTYLTVGKDWEKTGFRVTGFDIFTNPNVEYVTLDPMYTKDENPVPEKTEDDSDEDFYWLNGGK